MPSFTKQNILSALKHYFGYDDFRFTQEQIIDSVLAGQDVLAIMPTGAGKSICYQLPAVMLPGITIVVSPLIALMKDQVDAMRANGISAAFLNSSQDPGIQRSTISDAEHGKIKLLYIAPERIPANPDSFINFIKSLKPSLFAIDEAHCISSWGHDFRPDYLKLSVLKNKFPGVPVIALTASADGHTQSDIANKLALQQPKIFISSFNRPNISYFIRPKKNAFGHILEYLKHRSEESGIIYTLSRKSTEEIAGSLNSQGIKASRYHAGLDAAERSRVQEAFQRDEVKVIVATIAFGMGIDKSNVRFVIHYDVPKNIEGYYQETGRAGRDGLQSDAILFYSVADILKLRRFTEIEDNPQQSAITRKKLQQMQDFCEAEGCRRQYLMQYFGESFPPYCGSCDYCLSALEEKEATQDAQKLLSAIARTGEGYGAGYIIDFLRGSASEKIVPGHKELKTYGIGKNLKKEEWQWLIKAMLQQGMLSKTEDQYSSLQLNERSRKILKGETEVRLVMKKEQEQEATEDLGYEQQLLKELKAMRLELADREHVPAYIVVADNVLVELATYLPQNYDELKQVSGFGDFKATKYGASFLNVIRAYSKEHELHSRIHFKSPKRISKVKEEKPAVNKTNHISLQMFRDGMSVGEIAAQRQLTTGTVESHLSVFIASGEVPIEKLVPPDRLQEILQAIKATNQTTAAKPVKDMLGEDVSYGEIRLVMEYYKTVTNEAN